MILSFNQKNPDILIYSLSLWDLPNPVSIVATRVACELTRKPSGTLGILRLSSIYNEFNSPDIERATSLNYLLRNYTIAALQVVKKYNDDAKARWKATNTGTSIPQNELWHIVDPYPIFAPRRSESNYVPDNVHYTGIGSYTVSYTFMSIIAGCDAHCPDDILTRAVCSC